jgi:signal transduction histidine kinase
MIQSLRFRLAVGAVVAIGLSLAATWFALSRLFTDYVVDQYLSEMTVLADSLTAAVIVDGDRATLTTIPSDPRLSLPGGGRYWALEEGGVIRERSRSLWDMTFSRADMKPSSYVPFLETAGPDGELMLVLAQESGLGLGQRTKNFSVYTAFPKLELQTALKSFNSELLRMLSVTAALLVLAAIVQAIVGLSPLARLRRKVAAIRFGGITRMGEEGPSEVRPLVREIDLLLQEREEAIGRARSRASDLAHGLKTPLTVISQLVAEMEPKSAEMIFQQVDLIRQRADRQLQAARLGVERMMSSDLGELSGKLIQVLKPARADPEIDWQLDVRGDVRVEADPADLAEALGNVLDNASKWARTTIVVTVAREGDEVTVRIADDGDGIPQEELIVALARGKHSKDSNGGSGLGLAITADIADAYGAALSLEKTSLGGLEVTLRFPVKNGRRGGRSERKLSVRSPA